MSKRIGQIFEEARGTPEYRAEVAAMNFIVVCERRREELGLSYSELAKRIGVTKGRISQLMSGSASNMTLLTMHKLADALEFEFEFREPEKEIQTVESEKPALAHK